MTTTARRSLPTVVVALVTAVVAAGLALALARPGERASDHTSIRPAVATHTASGSRRTADLQAVLVDTPSTVAAAPSAPVVAPPLAPAPAPAALAAASRGPPNVAVTVIN